MGGESQFEMMAENHFLYDSSWASRTYGYINAEAGLFPYTLDYKTVQDCPTGSCPKCSYPGVWVQPMLDLEDEWLGVIDASKPDQGAPCSMLDGCIM